MSWVTAVVRRAMGLCRMNRGVSHAESVKGGTIATLSSSLLIVVVVACEVHGQEPRGAASLSNPPSRLPQNALELVQMRAYFDQTVWSEEVLAQAYERTFTNMWDELIRSADKFEVLGRRKFNRIIIGTPGQQESLDWGIQLMRLGSPTTAVLGDDWAGWLAEWEDSGYEIIETEWHHQKFEPPREGMNASSLVSFVIHVSNANSNHRFIIRGNLHVTWSTPPSGELDAVPDEIDATDVTILTRGGKPGFHEQSVEVLPTDATGKKLPSTIHPVMIYDLNADGLPEVVSADYNRVYWNRGNWKFEAQQLCTHPPRHPNAAVFADFTGDGVTDFFVGVKNGFPHLYVGAPDGQFPHEPRVFEFDAEMILVPTALAAGDIDGDGDLDVFLGQQKPGYHNGDIPTPYYDARDGFPAYLMLNDGTGNFKDVTEERGLAPKRLRRMFSATFIDFDSDGDQDLITTSDFSGTDLFENDGRGFFTDVNERMDPPGYAFGMSHTFGDYNLDGHLDFLLVGMSSTTARRLEQLNLQRAEFPDYNRARMLMGYGNRLYLGDGKGNFAQAPFNDTVARTGWSWGSTTLDFDNDTDVDLFVCNGQTSGMTTQDYCTRFWCHDVYYKAGERPDKAIAELFQKMQPLFSGFGVSWNGYEHNALLMNMGGREFLNIGYLMGAAHEFDARACASGDLDADGRVDLIAEHKDVRNNCSRLYFLRNQLESANHWVGFHLRSERGDVSPLGATVTLELPGGKVLKRYNVAGHSVWAQHEDTAHFGLGAATNVQRVIVNWPNGEATELSAPEPGKYHIVTPRKRPSATTSVSRSNGQ